MSDQWTYYWDCFSIFHSRIWATYLWFFILTWRTELSCGHFWRAVHASKSWKAHFFSHFPTWIGKLDSWLRCDVEIHVILKQVPLLTQRLILIECFSSSLQAEGDFLLYFAEMSLSAEFYFHKCFAWHRTLWKEIGWKEKQLMHTP